MRCFGSEITKVTVSVYRLSVLSAVSDNARFCNVGRAAKVCKQAVKYGICPDVVYALFEKGVCRLINVVHILKGYGVVCIVVCRRNT